VLIAGELADIGGSLYRLRQPSKKVGRDLTDDGLCFVDCSLAL
jgi:hypothetical protein